MSMKNRVGDYMTREVRVIRCDAEVHELEKLLLEEKVHGVPVVDGSSRLVGVVSQTDLLSWHYDAGADAPVGSESPKPDPTSPDVGTFETADSRTARVEDVMSPVVYCIGADRSIAEAAALMIQKFVHRLVVVDDGLKVLGILSAIDLLHALPEVGEALQRHNTETFSGPVS